VKVPPGTDVILANSWNAFAFQRPGAALVSVEHLLVLDPAFAPYRSFWQSAFHNTLVRRFEELSAAAADATVAVSMYTASQLREYVGGLEPEVILNGVDTGFFSPGEPVAPRSGRRTMKLLFVGSMSRRKGADLLSPIMRELGTGYELRFTGEPIEGGSFPREVGLIGLGRLDRNAIRAAYRDADLLLLPSRLEGLPLVALEAMACGTPVVASRTGSLIEVVEDGVNGRLCPVDDVAAFAAAIRRLRSAPDQLSKMGLAARRTAEQSFSLDRVTDEYLSLFERLIDIEAE